MLGLIHFTVTFNNCYIIIYAAIIQPMLLDKLSVRYEYIFYSIVVSFYMYFIMCKGRVQLLLTLYVNIFDS